MYQNFESVFNLKQKPSMKLILTRNSFDNGLIIVTRQDSIPWLWKTAPASRISYA